VPFVSEDPAKVAQEVPDFHYYVFPDAPGSHKYASLSLGELLFKDPAPTNLPQPGYQYSQLENGLKIVSVDKGGDIASVGLHVQAGSRFETPAQTGITHMVEMMAFRSTAHLSHLRTCKTLEVMGVEAEASVGREMLSYRAKFLRESLPFIVPILVGNVLYPRLVRWEVESAHKKIRDAQDALAANVDELVNEAVHQVAYHNNTLGMPLYATERSVDYFEENSIRQYMLDHFAPERCVLVGANVNHEDLCKWAMRSYVDYNPIPMKQRAEPKPVYNGGYNYISSNNPDTTVAISFELPRGWGSADTFALSVFETVLGGAVAGAEKSGGAFLSKLTQSVVAGNPAVGSSMAFSNLYSDSGLWGVAGSVAPEYVPGYIESVAKTLQAPVTADEVKRAKAQLKAAASISVDKAEDCADDMAKQVLMGGGKVLTPAEISAKIDAVTEAQIAGLQKLA